MLLCRKHVTEEIIGLQVLEGELIFAAEKESKLLRIGEKIALYKGCQHSAKANKETVFLLSCVQPISAKYFS